jgi:hypothetical protein
MGYILGGLKIGFLCSQSNEDRNATIDAGHWGNSISINVAHNDAQCLRTICLETTCSNTGEVTELDSSVMDTFGVFFEISELPRSARETVE